MLDKHGIGVLPRQGQRKPVPGLRTALERSSQELQVSRSGCWMRFSRRLVGGKLRGQNQESW